MQVAMIGLGRMGGGMVRRLIDGGHDVIGIDPDRDARDAVAALGATTSDTITDLPGLMAGPRVVWLMVTPGDVTDNLIRVLAGLLDAGDLVVDGGNSDFRGAAGNRAVLAERGIAFVDAGVSGGQWGFRAGYGVMVGGDPDDVARIQPVLDALAADGGATRVGDVGTGHLVKAVHNGVQYALLQAYAEGFALLGKHPEVDLPAALQAWQRGSSVRSYLLEQIIAAVDEHGDLSGLPTAVTDSGMSRWTAEEAIRLAVPTPILTAALHARFASRDDQTANRLLNAARDQIGGKP